VQTSVSVPETPIVQTTTDLTTSDPVMVAIESPSLSGTLQINGSTVNQLDLTQYRQTTDSDSPAVTLLQKNYTLG
jgi:hypothetical protein